MNPEISTCCTCDFSWPTGQDGSHICSVYMGAKIAEQAQEIERLKDVKRAYDDALGVSNELGYAYTPVADCMRHMGEEIERLNAHCLRLGQGDAERYWEGRWRDADAELSQLKSRQSGVVLPERSDERGSDGKLTYEAKARNACIDEIAHLNSSAVSAVEEDDQASDIEAERLTAEVLGVGAGINLNATSIDDIFLDGSSVVVDERAAFEAHYKHFNLSRDFLSGAYADKELRCLWDAWQARAALSAPSHSEQVQGKYAEVLNPFVAMMENELHANAGKGDRPGWLKMDRKTALLEIYYHLAKLQKAAEDDYLDGIIEYAADVANMSMMLVDVCGLLYATPSPGKQQGGDV